MKENKMSRILSSYKCDDSGENIYQKCYFCAIRDTCF